MKFTLAPAAVFALLAIGVAAAPQAETSSPTTSGDASTPTGLTETECSAHSDHWHCPEGVEEPATAPTEADIAAGEEGHDHEHEGEGGLTDTECEAHGDHWHCPEGVDEPESHPTEADIAAAEGDHGHDHSGEGEGLTETECEAHGDHWHCPEGVDEPATPPTEADNAAGEEGTEESSAAALRPLSLVGGVAAAVVFFF